eukprot:998759-Pyramimonas_sp.AAC.1
MGSSALSIMEKSLRWLGTLNSDLLHFEVTLVLLYAFSDGARPPVGRSLFSSQGSRPVVLETNENH